MSNKIKVFSEKEIITAISVFKLYLQTHPKKSLSRQILEETAQVIDQLRGLTGKL
jgi:hypothetical protein